MRRHARLGSRTERQPVLRAPAAQYPGTCSGPGRAPQSDGAEAISYLLFGLGGGLLALSPILPWINIFLIGSVSLFQLASLSHSVAVFPWAMVGIGVGMVLATLSRSSLKTLSAVSAITVVLSVILGGSDIAELIRAANASHGVANLGIGMYAAGAALVLLSIAAWREHRIARESSSRQAYQVARPTSPAPQDPRPGFKPDPWGAPGYLRYWDGGSWGPETR